MAYYQRLFSLVLLFAAIAVHAQQNVSGRWQGSFDIPGPDGSAQHDTAFLTLQQNGTLVTGGAGRNEEMQKPLSDGLFHDGKLTFTLYVRPGTTVQFNLTLDGDHLRGIATWLPPDPTVKVAVDVVRMPNPTISTMLEHFMGSILIVRDGEHLSPRMAAAISAVRSVSAELGVSTR